MDRLRTSKNVNTSFFTSREVWRSVERKLGWPRSRVIVLAKRTEVSPRPVARDRDRPSGNGTERGAPCIMHEHVIPVLDLREQ